jgi:hypothetical protein
MFDFNRSRGHSAAPVSGGALRSTRRGSSFAFRRLRAERGQTVVEFALVLPLVAALVFVLVAFGKILFYYIDLTHLANEGARYGAVNVFPGGKTSPGAYLCPKLGSDADTTNKKIIVSFPSPSAGGPTAGDSVQVTASVDYKLIPYWGGATFSMAAGASMRLEQKPSFTAGTAAC